MRSRGVRTAMMALAAIAGASAPAPLSAQASETAVKAAFLPKFARYVTWPAAARPRNGEPYQLCLIGTDPFGPSIDRAAASERIDGRPVSVRRIAGAAGADGCHVAFVHGTAGESTARILAGLRQRAVLTVTDSRAGGDRGMIHFVVADDRVRFYIDEAEASRHGLSISSRLLSLAIGVRQRRG